MSFIQELKEKVLGGYEINREEAVKLLDADLDELTKAIEAKVGDDFDPNLHQAIMTEKVDGMEPNKITEELQKGYMLKDRVIRATLVKVSE